MQSLALFLVSPPQEPQGKQPRSPGSSLGPWQFSGPSLWALTKGSKAAAMAQGVKQQCLSHAPRAELLHALRLKHRAEVEQLLSLQNPLGS